MADHTPPPEVSAALTEASRELGLWVDDQGVIRWMDERARKLGFAVGGNLLDRVVPGVEDKARELCRQGCQHKVAGWELPLVVDGAPAVALFCAVPSAGGAVLHASLIAQDYADAIGEGNRAVHEIVGLNRELARQKLRLEESNSAIRALHGELAQQADRLRQSAEVKARLVAGVSHEFRTPLHSILGLSRLLLSGSDGPLNSEQETQVKFVRDSAEELSRMINDMLDLARIDAGSVLIRAEPFQLRELFAALRGTMIPLVPDDAPFELIFDPAPDVSLETDPGKLSQILRNLIANAIKFTERGTIRVTPTVADGHLAVEVADSGIGIAAADQPRVFDEFTQIDSPLQRTTRGTGLGLPLAKKLAESLGGTLALRSRPGAGS
ncbi:MAG TPA: HAMP domain-containing sensor histidine kinase, partial [Kofleriaceae bacterium]